MFPVESSRLFLFMYHRRIPGHYCQARLLLLLVAALSWLPSPARALELTGELIQGGLVMGKVSAGTRVTLDGEAIPVTDEGRFVLGFDRDAPPTAELRLAYPDGETTSRELAIRQREYDIERIDGLPERKVTPPKETLERIQQEARQIEAAREKAQQTEHLYTDGNFIWPLLGRISGVYGSQRILNGKPKRPHYGVDIVASRGSPVQAPADGVVAFTHPGMYFNGKTVVLNHGLGLTSTYIHLSETEVEQGAWVDQGQTIGRVGNTGRTTGPHLHWGISWFDRHIDPRLLVEAMPE